MIKHVSHTAAGTDPAGLTLALTVAYELHAPAARAPELPPQLMGLHITAAHPHRRKVPLNRLTAMRG